VLRVTVSFGRVSHRVTRGELKTKQGASNLGELRENFVKHAAKYAQRERIPKQAFRDAGVPTADVREAGIRYLLVCGLRW